MKVQTGIHITFGLPSHFIKKSISQQTPGLSTLVHYHKVSLGKKYTPCIMAPNTNVRIFTHNNDFSAIIYFILRHMIIGTDLS